MSTVQQFGGNTTAVTVDDTLLTWTDANGNGQVDRGDVVTQTNQSEGTVLSYVVGGGEAMQVSDALTRTTMWDVFFDVQTGTRTNDFHFVPPPPRAGDPIVLDLNHNGRADVTGQAGDGVITGGVRGFDFTPSDRQWTHRANNWAAFGQANRLAGGQAVTATVFDANGNEVSRFNTPAGTAPLTSLEQWATGSAGLQPNQRVEVRDGDGRLVAEIKWEPGNTITDQMGQGNPWVFYFGNANRNEWTSAWSADGGGDGLLVWDVDGDGRVTSGVELFGHTDLDGSERFAHGFEKLAAHFDRDGNGIVSGPEVNGLQIWEDRDADGITDEGELVSLADHGIEFLDLRTFNPEDMSATAAGGGLQLDNVTWTSAAAEDSVVAAFNAVFQDARDGQIDDRGLVQAVSTAVSAGGRVDAIGRVQSDIGLVLGDGRTRIEFDVDPDNGGRPNFDLSMIDRDGQQQSLTIGADISGTVAVSNTTGNDAAQAVVANRQLVEFNEYRGANVTSGVSVFGRESGRAADRPFVDVDGRLDYATGRVTRDSIRHYEAIARGVTSEVWNRAFGGGEDESDQARPRTNPVTTTRGREPRRSEGTTDPQGIGPGLDLGVADPVITFVNALTEDDGNGGDQREAMS